MEYENKKLFNYLIQRSIMKNILIIISAVILIPAFFEISFAKDYWSGEVRTKESFLYGRIEVRMKSAQASGVTSTLFTYNTSSSIYNEIDIEIMGKDNDEVQYTTFTPDQTGVNFRQTVSFNPHASFHVHAIEWTPDYVAWYVDGFEIHRDNSDRIKALFLPQAIMMNFWMPNSVDWAGTFNDNNLPLYAMYDWVKYYEYTPGENDNFTLKWTDDFNSFDGNRWAKSSSTFASNYCDFKTQNVLIKDGYLLLCMTKSGQTANYANSIEDEDIDAPYPVNGWIFGNEMSVEFSEEVDETSAENISNYITLGLTLSNANLLSSKRKIIFNAENAASSTTYPAAFIGIKDLAANPNSSGLKKFNLQSTHYLPLVVDIGNDQDISEDFLKDQKWDGTKEYGRIGGDIKTESSFTSSGDYSFLCNNGVEGITFYRFRLKNGNYNLKMFFVESEKTKAGERVFDVFINGEEKISHFDIFNETGTNKVLEKTINGINVDDNLLEIYFKPENGFPIIHGIIIGRDSTTSVEDSNTRTGGIGLESYPNPFNSTTNIRFTLAKQNTVKISVYDALGRLCRILTYEKFDTGDHIIKFNAGSLSSGLYFVSLNTPDKAMFRKILYLK
jgi:hypothetical protein